LRDMPVIVGGGRRGVVTTACYIARTSGVRSAMPMFQARQLCPGATIVPPDMAKYVAVARQVRALMLELTPLVEPLSIDEAFLDLSGTERLHGMTAAKSLAQFAGRVEVEIGITVSIGLSENKFLAKIASDLSKPRGFSVLARNEAAAFLAAKPVTFIWGVGKATGARLLREGFRTVGDLQVADSTKLLRLFGGEGLRLARLAHGIDARAVTPLRQAKSISAETTFEQDLASLRQLERVLWSLSEKVSVRLKAKQLVGGTVTLKLKSADFRARTRARALGAPTQLAERIFAAGRDLLTKEIDGTRFRLIGIAVAQLTPSGDCDYADLVDARGQRAAAAERAVDRLRAKFGHAAVVRGLSFDDDA